MADASTRLSLLFLLRLAGRWNRAVQLPCHALRPKTAEIFQRLHAGFKFVIRTELRRVLFNIRRNQAVRLVDEAVDIRRLQNSS